MKRQSIIRTVMAMTLAMSLLTTGLIAQGANQTKPVVEVKKEMVYKTLEGTITEIRKNSGSLLIEITNAKTELAINMGKDIFIIDEKDTTFKTIADLKVGMKVVAILDKKAPTTTSLPPRTNGAIGFVIKADGHYLDLSICGSKLINRENKLKLTVGDRTNIIDAKGTRRIVTEEDIKNNECLVFYTSKTKSIPATTTPELVMILDRTASIDIDRIDICKHGIDEYLCKYCSNDLCKHGIDEDICKVCNDDICKHGVDEDLCKMCNDDICKHGIDEDLCKHCSNDLCKHGVDEDICRVCNDDICKHGIDEYICSKCNDVKGNHHDSKDLCKHGIDEDHCNICD